ncbi:Tim10/DDP family zinc finger [Cinnamomum micranthum f. kanehirae]|uniref:Mitochondrial import inner membrane translocase subunit n=1 Tax=Cinnamomum micranthum f. kanehirae TaxID=337451 RepID=A0A3S3PUJ5_9MAGN|nr:Tim10/DDP family zinc finger [Cinnamomum micranthum f. kanehirae]
MDSSSLDSVELQRFLQQEKERAMVTEMVGKLTDVCWDKCITSTPGSKFSSGESSCLTNCAQRPNYPYRSRRGRTASAGSPSDTSRRFNRMDMN